MNNPIRLAENDMHNEADLMLRVSRGDAYAFRKVFDHYRDRIYSLGMHLTRSETLSEELVQDVFMKVWENRAQLATIHYFNAWLRTVAKNTSSNYLRSLAIERLAMLRLAENSVEAAGSTDSKVLVKEFEQIIDEAIKRLPPQQKKVYLLSRQFSKKQEEIARELNISVYTVKEYLKLARRSIRLQVENSAELAVLAAITCYFQ